MTSEIEHHPRCKERSSLKEPNSAKDRSSKSAHPSPLKKTIATEGGVLSSNGITLQIGLGCLAEETEITLTKVDEHDAFKSLLNLGLISTAPPVFEFLPSGLTFLRPANLTIRFEKTDPKTELFILHGSHQRHDLKAVWGLVHDKNIIYTTDKDAKMKIEGFSFYTYFFATRLMLARILSHLNNSFSSCAYAFHRRQPPMDTIDISIVLVSQFVDHDESGESEQNIKQLKDHYKESYIKGDKGMSKEVQTNQDLKMCLDFPGIESNPFSFKVNQSELDSIGFVVDHFKGTAIDSPASGAVKIFASDDSVLWRLTIHEIEEKNRDDETYVERTKADPETEVIYRNTKLTTMEISRISRMLAMDWDSLAGLMDISYCEREEIRANYAKYPDSPSKAEKILWLFNGAEDFDRYTVEKAVEELGRHDLKKEFLPVENETKNEPSPALGSEISQQNGNCEEMAEGEELPEESDVLHHENVQLRNTPLSPREMFKLSQHIAVDWDSLAGLMNIAREERDDIRCNTCYNDHRSRAEKILAMFNRKPDFSRKALRKCLEGIQKLDVIKPIITGKWRYL